MYPSYETDSDKIDILKIADRYRASALTAAEYDELMCGDLKELFEQYSGHIYINALLLGESITVAVYRNSDGCNVSYVFHEKDYFEKAEEAHYFTFPTVCMAYGFSLGLMFEIISADFDINDPNIRV